MLNTTNVLIAVVVILVLWVVVIYNRLISLRFRAKEAMSDIDVQLKRRFDLIPNLVEIVKGYVSHEKGVLENVTRARASVASNSGSPLERDKAENMLSGTLKTLFAVAENYPDLKASSNFIELQKELSDTENKIQASRRFYNTTIMDLNTAIGTFPTNIMAGAFGFQEEKFFEVNSEKEKEPIKVQF